MRLNFSGVGDDAIHEGVARIGKVINEQVRLYSTLTGTEPAAPRRGQRDTIAPSDSEAAGARVVPLRRRAGGDR
jgi:2-aminoadipate transaminase